MKYGNQTTRLVFALTMFVFCAADIPAQTKANPQTVVDYYLLLPTENLPILESVANRRSIIKKQDLKNGYLRLEGGWEGWAEIALFRKKNREAVIGVAEVGCGPACSGAAQFLTFRNGKWTDVTTKVMPELEDADILAAYNRLKTKDDDAHSLDDMPYTYWQMPQKGTTLKLLLGDESESSGKTLINFAWNGERFVKAAK